MNAAAAPPDYVAYYARTRGGKLACVDLERGVELSYAALDARATRVAAMLEALFAARGKAVRGQRVAVLARNSSDFVCIYFGCLRAGAVLQPLNWRLAPAELAALGEDGEPGLVLFDSAFSAGASALARACPEAMALELDGAGADGFEAALKRAPERPDLAYPADDEAAATLLYTSGTTGKAKGVILTEGNARANAVNYALAAHVDAHSVSLCDMPLFHIAALGAVMRAPLQHGGTVLISTRFDVEQTTRRIADAKLGVTHYFCVPQMAEQLRRAAGYDPAHFRGLVALQTGGAPHPEASVRAWLDDGVSLINGYGTTEGGTILGQPVGDLELLKRKAASSGVPSIFADLRLVGRDGRDVEAGEIGEIWVRGGAVSPGYWRNETATAAAFQDGWLKTGDAARRDADGFYILVDRWKDMFISGGENVYPAEVEAAIMELPGIAEAVVFGVPDARWGECGVAYFLCASGVQVTAEAVIAHCRARLASYKAPKQVHVASEFPRTASGKVQKAILRARWIEENKT